MGALENGGTDFDSMFEPYHSGTKAATTHIQYNGQDLANRYQAVAAGNGTAYGATHVKANGTDIGTLFVKKGTYSAGMTATVNTTSLSSSASSKGTYTIGTVTITASGGSGSYTYQTASLTSGSDSGSYTNITASRSGNVYTWHATIINAGQGPEVVHGVWQIGVSDGSTTKTFSISVSWN